MASLCVFYFLVFFHFVSLLSVGHENENCDECPKSFKCGQLGNMSFPFTKPELQGSGLISIHGCDGPSSNTSIDLEKNGRYIWLKQVLQQHNHYNITLCDEDLHKRLRSRNCEAFNRNKIPPPSFQNDPLASFHIIPNKATSSECKNDPPNRFLDGLVNPIVCGDYTIYCKDTHGSSPTPEQTQNPSPPCSILQPPCENLPHPKNSSSLFCGKIVIDVHLSDDCDKCYCYKEDSKLFKLWVGLGLGLGGLFILIIIWHLCKQHYKHKCASSNVQLQSANNNAIACNSHTDLESGRAYNYGISLFSYEELEKATNNFDRSRELGNGGFGTVYYGKLQDGREVAVKRLYDHNYKRKEQFMNEVNILTRLRHPNLVSLYGYTSRRCRELLLVYECIPNGTLSCHLHGDLANHDLLPWPIRIRIAIETASALAYLHASDTIHRDVKTNNILLENNFSVKVVDFGLSRLFPDDVTHVSTAPQGTPGYVDPDYYLCYQLTSKSDVYSFGVVLIELISSLPAIDMNRSRDEINLANLAINKIQKSAFGELVDPSLGFESNNEVRRMIVSVAELAFQCLQKERDLRPSMDEVLEILKRIESGHEQLNHIEEVDIHGVNGISFSGPILPPSSPSPDYEEAILLKTTKSLPSPKVITDKWHSEPTTSNVSA